MRRRTPFALGAAGLVVLGATSCGGAPTSDDFRSEAETFIESDEFAEDPTVGVDITEAQCTEPAATAIGTTFTCTGTAPDGQTYAFDAAITDEREIAVGLAAGGAPSATDPAGTVAPTTAAG